MPPNVIAAAADIAFIIDGDGVVRDLALSEKDLLTNPQDTWLGQPWLETVTKESQPKVREMLAAAADKAAPRWRQVNHPTAEGGSVAVRLCCVPLGKKGTYHRNRP